jgi:hypothetical protein
LRGCVAVALAVAAAGAAVALVCELTVPIDGEARGRDAGVVAAVVETDSLGLSRGLWLALCCTVRCDAIGVGAGGV